MRAPGLAVACCLLVAAGWAIAQPIYRSVGADGRVTFSDRPLPTGSAPTGSTLPSQTAAPAPLPYALQQVAERFPVTLYAGPNCAPCDSARQLLATRGVPFSERSVDSNEDIEALQRLSGDTSLPTVNIGAQQLRGFAAAEWTQYLDAAGYPSTSQLPPGYRPASVRPLVALQPAVAASAPAEQATPAAPARTVAGPQLRPPPANPAGIQF